MRNIVLAISLLLTVVTNSNAKVRYQKVTINTASSNKIYIDGKLAEPEDGKYLLVKNQKTHTIVAKRKGYKDDVICAVPYGSNGYTYPLSYKVGLNMVKLPTKLNEAKNLRINNVAIDLKNENNKIRIFSDYNKYLKKATKYAAFQSKEEKDIEYDNTVFSYTLNQFLKTTGFIDTSDNIFNNGYLNNLITDVTVTEYTYHRAPAHAYYDYGGMLYVEIKATWKLMDIYNQEIYTLENEMTSGYWGYKNNKDLSVVVKESITDALSYGLIDFIKTEAVKKALKDNSAVNEENNFTEIKLNTNDNFVSSLSEAVKSSVTVKAKDSHGSGFLISNDGYIITNYHVILDAEELKIVLNNNKEYDVTIERVSKIHDLALLKINETNLKPFRISKSEEIEIATDIFAVGTPKAEDLSQTVSKGIVSGVRKTDQESELIQIDASINPGNSGGAITTSDGLVIGIVSSKIYGLGVEGLGFGIPSYQILKKLNLKQ